MSSQRRSRLRVFASRVCGFLGVRRREAEFDGEIQRHLQLLAERFQAQGMSREEAAAAARRQFGNTTLLQEDHRELQTFPWIEAMWQDLRFAARMLRKNPGFTAVVVLSLALGIGANTAIFSIINSVILEPLPFPDADQLVRLEATKDGTSLARGGYYGGPSPLDVRDYIRGNHTFQQIVVYDSWRKNVSLGAGVSEPEQMRDRKSVV